ncbi:DUF6053 domain-containing protein [Lysobacter sp. CA199]|uniref:DUF6053 domain-containing protein n=1 Tax=Lysobacter sp. CA199 TaxID=3455608 RepID=UPI003F8D22A7
MRVHGGTRECRRACHDLDDGRRSFVGGASAPTLSGQIAVPGAKSVGAEAPPTKGFAVSNPGRRSPRRPMARNPACRASLPPIRQRDRLRSRCRNAQEQGYFNALNRKRCGLAPSSPMRRFLSSSYSR